MWPTTFSHFLWLRVFVLDLSSFLGKFLLALILVYRIYQRSGVYCLRPLSFGLACFQGLFIFYPSFWEFCWFVLEASLLSYSRESQIASGVWWCYWNRCCLWSFEALCDTCIKFLRVLDSGGWVCTFRKARSGEAGSIGQILTTTDILFYALFVPFFERGIHFPFFVI